MNIDEKMCFSQNKKENLLNITLFNIGVKQSLKDIIEMMKIYNPYLRIFIRLYGYVCFLKSFI